jgi:hypothetical protein
MNAAIYRVLRCHLVACAAAAACSIASALPTDPAETAGMTSAQLRTAYLECDHLSAQAILAQDEMIACVAVGDVLLQRDFGGELERMLHWWRGARVAFAASAAALGGSTGSMPISGRFEP